MDSTWQQDVLSCTACPLCIGKNIVVGDGPVPCKYMLIGEGPGEIEDRTGIPFMGDAGRELEYYLGLAGLSRKDVFLTNIVKHRPTTKDGHNRAPKDSEVSSCRHWLEKEIQWVQPKIILLLGATALTTMFPGSSLKEHGIPLKRSERYWIPMYHPAASLHNPSLKSVIEADWKRFPEKIENMSFAQSAAQIFTRDAIAIDTETTGLDPTKAELVCVSAAISNESHVWFDGFHIDNLLSTDLVKVYHNYKYEYKLFRTMGLHPKPPVFDTMIAAALLGEEQIGLKILARKYLGRQMNSAKALIAEAQTKINSAWLSSVGGTKITKKLTLAHGAPPIATMRDVPPGELTPYAAEDAQAALELYQRFASEIEKQGLERIMDLEMELTPILAEMEMKGVLVDVDYLKALKAKWVKETKEIASKYPINLHSSSQIGKHMETLRLPILATTDTGKASTSKAALLPYKEHPFIRDLLQYKEMAKLISTYTDSIINKVGPDSRIHPEYNQVRGDSEDWRGATKTGRLSSSNPNFQNLPDRTEEGMKVRRVVVSPPGMSLVSFDYSQIEPLIIAYRAGDRALLSLYSSGGDVYGGVAQDLNIDRSTAKILVLAISYGAQKWKISEKAGISIEEAAEVIRKFFESYPDVAKYIQEISSEAYQYGYTKTIWGRRRTESGVFSMDWGVRQLATRELLNHTIQGTAADLCKRAMVNCYQAGFLPIIQVHDELVFEVPDDAIDTTTQHVIQCMQAMNLGVPIRISVKVGKNWGEMRAYSRVGV